jgi:hypothetical protein
MRTKIIISILTLTAVSIFFGLNEANAAVSVQVGTPNVNFSISDYQPAPPNVYVLSDRGRPYYMERNRRVYMERRKPGKHYKYDKRHEDRGRDNGHDRGNR